ncbi:MAG TPA: [citrate (pro-3S)-lyase] ligase [Candidatus Avidesulfovibrio excrementigallinarum]|nr:[citrate (pro-3S)-lyase] ligase [Candidatus Avidesulfovibrio excrementigallinarum]
MYSERQLTTSWELKERAALLASRGLEEPGRERYILGLYDDDERLVATGSLVGNTLQGIAVDIRHDGEGLISQLVSSLMAHAAQTGPLQDLRIFTKADMASRFASLGYHMVANTGRVALLEWESLFPRRLKQLAELAASLPAAGVSGAIVMNANPFTKGHEWLVRQALDRCDRLFVLVVEEDCSLFPFADRFALVREGVAALPAGQAERAVVMPGGPYCISSATFPSYFTRQQDRVAVHAELDLDLFARQAAALGVTRRFAGTEPYCPATSAYNETMQRVLPPHGIEVVLLPRLEQDGQAISASRVRSLLEEGRFEEAGQLLPPATRAHCLDVARRLHPHQDCSKTGGDCAPQSRN